MKRIKKIKMWSVVAICLGGLAMFLGSALGFLVLMGGLVGFVYARIME